MAIPPIVLWFSVFGGYSEQQIGSLRQDQGLVELSQAQDVISDPLGKLVTRPGFSRVRSTAISGTPTLTGMFHMGSLADEFILGGAGTLYRDNANPPGAITGGTGFTNSATNLLRGDVFNDLLIICSQSRDLPQTLNSAVTRADLGGTPARGLDVKAFARRVCMFSPIYSGTTYRSLMSFTSANDDQSAWTNPVTTNFLNFGRTGDDVNVLGGEFYSQDELIAFTEDKLFRVYPTPNASAPLASQGPLFAEEGGGPPVIHSVVKADHRLFWISRNLDIKMLVNGHVVSIGYPIQPFLRGLNAAQLTNLVGGWEPKYRMVVWGAADGASSTHNVVLAMHVDRVGGSYPFFIHTLNRTAFANRIVSGESRLIGGGLAGLFYNEYDGSTTGSADNATAIIDADVMTPPFHLGLPGMIKKGVYAAVEFDPIGTEAVTVQFQYNDSSTWVSPPEGTVTMTGVDSQYGIFRLNPFVTHRVRFRDANAGERMRVIRYGYSRPTSTYATR